MSGISLMLTGAPGWYRLGLWDNQASCVVAVVKGPARHMQVGDRWVVKDTEGYSMVVVVPTTVDLADPGRHAWCLVDADAVRL